MPRFVVLRHEIEDKTHFDLMIENEGVLMTFSFPEFPGAGMSGERIADHRMKYLDFQGSLSENRGRVKREDAGTFDLLTAQDECIHVHARGERLTGGLRLVKKSGDTWALEPE